MPDVTKSLHELSRVALLTADLLAPDVERAGAILQNALRRGNKVLVCGNGGSAADAQHFAAELMGHMRQERPGLPAIALSSDPSTVTAIANDYGYQQVFARQVEALGKPGDVLLAISTSGKSPNIREAAVAASIKGLHVIALIGEAWHPWVEHCEAVLAVPSGDTQRIQEIHTAIIHALCEYLEPEAVLTSDKEYLGVQA